MFDSIAHRYDLLNHLLSAGIDRLWRKKAISLLAADSPATILDVATGTADLAIEALKLQPDAVIGIDISNEMLEIGREKVRRIGKADVIDLRQGASEKLPLADGSFDAAVVGFGVRNFEDLDIGLREIHRVLAPGGRLAVLEFSQPGGFPVKQVYDFYFKHVVPRVGKAVSRHETAYEYLNESVDAFPYGEAFLNVMGRAGFNERTAYPQTFGIASIYIGRKPV